MGGAQNTMPKTGHLCGKLHKYHDRDNTLQVVNGANMCIHKNKLGTN